MEFKDIPESVQIIAANHLCELLKPAVSGETGEPAIKLAGRVSKAFTALYSLSECEQTQIDNDSTCK